jgi:5-hydroxyisourate hydrolase
MAGITTHVLDTANGRPASGIAVRLEVDSGGTWERVGEGRTDSDGRVRTLTDGFEMRAATYRITFETNTPFYPYVSIVFRVEDAGQHYHVPLLLSPYGYSTYRGS